MQQTRGGEDTEEIDEEGSVDDESTTLGVDVLRDSEASCSSSDAGTPSGQKRKYFTFTENHIYCQFIYL